MTRLASLLGLLAQGLTRGFWTCSECGTVNDSNASHCAGCGKS